MEELVRDLTSVFPMQKSRAREMITRAFLREREEMVLEMLDRAPDACDDRCLGSADWVEGWNAFRTEMLDRMGGTIAGDGERGC